MVTVNSPFYPNCPRQQWDNRSSPPLARPLALDVTVARALREQCNIPFESFFLVCHMGGGQFAYFSGPRPISEEDIRRMFRRDKFLQFQNRTSPRESLSLAHEDDHYQDAVGGAYPDNHSLDLNGHLQPPSRGRKRPRRSGMLGRGVDNDGPAPVITSSKQPLEIGNSDAVWAFYDHRFKCVQQTACKEIAKAFIKILAPKKQANNPYTRGDATAPWWWPKPWGPGEKDRVRHLEPDHQWKKERVYLLVHILKLVIQPPERQHPDIQKLEINVARLESVAMDSLASFFEDRGKPTNAKKKPILKELFKVARMQEKFMRNEIDATTQVFITADDMVMDCCFDPDDEENDEEEQVADATNERGRTGSVHCPTASPTRATAMSQTLAHGLPSTSTNHAVATAQMQAAPFMYEIPIRRQNQFDPQAMVPSDLAQDQYSYSENGSPAAVGPQTSLQAHAPAVLQMHDLLASPHHEHPADTVRRPTLFGSPAQDFAGAPPSTMFHGPWTHSSSQQSTPASAVTTPETPSLYAYPTAAAPVAHQQAHQQTAAPIPPALPLPPTPSQQSQQQPQQHQQQQAPAQCAGGHYGLTTATQFDGLHHHRHQTTNDRHQQHQHQHPQQQQQQQTYAHSFYRSGAIQLAVQSHQHHHHHQQQQQQQQQR